MDLVFIIENLEGGVLWGVQNLGILIAVATVFTALTPSRSKGILTGMALQLLNLLAGNVGYNRNADDQ